MNEAPLLELTGVSKDFLVEPSMLRRLSGPGRSAMPLKYRQSWSVRKCTVCRLDSRFRGNDAGGVGYAPCGLHFGVSGNDDKKRSREERQAG